jgi:hypothetical protein
MGADCAVVGLFLVRLAEVSVLEFREKRKPRRHCRLMTKNR